MSEREERAFRAAFEQHAEEFEPARLSPPYGPRRNGALVAAVAAVVVLIAGGVAVLATQQTGPTGSASSTAVGSAGAAGGLPHVRAGWKWVSERDVTVQVPDNWGWRDSPDDGMCDHAAPRDRKVAPGPFVTYDASQGMDGLVGCHAQDAPAGFPQEAAVATWQPFLAFGRVAAGRTAFRGWTLITRPVGTTGVSILVPTREVALGQRIADSARAFTTDPNGCTATSPVQATRPVRPPAGQPDPTGHPTSGVLCQYTRTDGTGVPGLLGSRRLDATEATRLSAAIDAAPAGGGPDYPDDCMDPTEGDSAVVVLLRYGAITVQRYAYYDQCTGNGIDDGTTVHAITSADCRPLFGDAIEIVGGHQGIVQRCSSPK